MKKFILLLMGLFYLSCNDGNSDNEDSSMPMQRPPNIELIILNNKGEKLLATGAINREDLIVEEKENGIYTVNNESKENWCEIDKSGIVLFDYRNTMASSYEGDYRITFPDQSVYLINVKVQKEEGNNYHWYIEKITINNNVVFTGDITEQGTYCDNYGALQINLIKE